jgi:hypothetical protein
MTARDSVAACRAGIVVSIDLVALNPRTKGAACCALHFITRAGSILGRRRTLDPAHNKRPNGRTSELTRGEHYTALPGSPE